MLSVRLLAADKSSETLLPFVGRGTEEFKGQILLSSCKTCLRKKHEIYRLTVTVKLCQVPN